MIFRATGKPKVDIRVRRLCRARPECERPILLLDVDGVINILWDDDGLETRSTNVDGPRATTYPITYLPSIVKRINAINKNLADVVWHTTWGSFAKTNLAPALGFEDFAVSSMDHKCDRQVKVEFAKAVNRGRTLVWLDDDVHNLLNKTESEWFLSRPGPTQCLNPYPLTPVDLDFIEKFLADPHAYAETRKLRDSPSFFRRQRKVKQWWL